MPGDLKQLHGYASFEDWYAELVAESERQFPDGSMDDYYSYPSGWRDYYEDGYSPSSAIHEDQSYWDGADE